MTRLNESPYGESQVIIWNEAYFVVLRSWEALAERSGTGRLDNITLYPCRECDRMPNYSNLDRDFVAGSLYWASTGEDHSQYAFYCRPCAARVLQEFGYVRRAAPTA